MNYLLFIIREACKELEARVTVAPPPKGEKKALVEAAILRREGPFRVADLAADCPGVSIDTIRRVLKNLKGTKVECLGRGVQAQWRRMN